MLHFVPFPQKFDWDNSHNHICSASSGLVCKDEAIIMIEIPRSILRFKFFAIQIKIKICTVILEYILILKSWVLRNELDIEGIRFTILPSFLSSGFDNEV